MNNPQKMGTEGTEEKYTPLSKMYIKKKDKTKTGILCGEQMERFTQEDQEQSRRRAIN